MADRGVRLLLCVVAFLLLLYQLVELVGHLLQPVLDAPRDRGVQRLVATERSEEPWSVWAIYVVLT